MLFLPDLFHRVSLRTFVTFLMGGIYLLKKLYLRRIRKRAKDWPSIQAVVEHTRSRQLDNDEGKGWVGELAYSYSVNSEYYAGFHHFKARNEADAERLIQGWKDRRVAVHYDPSDPSLSVFLVDEQQQSAAQFHAFHQRGWASTGDLES
jgi:hypothetical protein